MNGTDEVEVFAGEDHRMVRISPPRKLNSNEQQLLGKLADAAGWSQTEFRCQAKHAAVIEECAAGCGTVGLAVDADACPPAALHGTNPASAQGRLRSGEQVRIVILVEQGYLRQMECYLATGGVPRGLPNADALEYYG